MFIRLATVNLALWFRIFNDNYSRKLKAISFMKTNAAYNRINDFKAWVIGSYTYCVVTSFSKLHLYAFIIYPPIL